MKTRWRLDVAMRRAIGGLCPVRCATEADWLKWATNSTRRWIKKSAQVMSHY
jgi:hypothetical protein